jgi:hypothetical protein
LWQPRPDNGKTFVFDKSRLGNTYMWVDPNMPTKGALITEELRGALEAAKIESMGLSCGFRRNRLYLPRYRHQTLADLAHLFVTLLMRDRVAIARRVSKAPVGAGGTGKDTVVGIALWGNGIGCGRCQFKIKPLREVRKPRQKTAHIIQENAYPPKYEERQQ